MERGREVERERGEQNSVVKHVLRMYKSLDLIPSKRKNKRQGGREKNSKLIFIIA